MAQCGICLGHSLCRLCANGPIDSDDMNAAAWCWNVQMLVDCVNIIVGELLSGGKHNGSWMLLLSSRVCTKNKLSSL